MTSKALHCFGLLSQLQKRLKNVIRPYVSLKFAINLQKLDRQKHDVWIDFKEVNKMESDERYRRAKHRIGELKGFYGHLATYGGVIGLLFLIDLLTGGVWWFFWPLFGWGIGVAAHAFNVFGKEAWLGSEWEKKKIEELMDKMDRD